MPITIRPHLMNLTAEELQAHFATWGWPKFRSDQVMEWVFRHRITDPQQMTNLTRRDREQLASGLDILRSVLVKRQDASDGVRKLLLAWPGDQTDPTDAAGANEVDEAQDTPDRQTLPLTTLNDHQRADGIVGETECVMIPSDPERSPGKLRRTVCVSSQVGCPVGCRFCASGLDGLTRDLTAGQIVEQVWILDKIIADEAVRERAQKQLEPLPAEQLPGITHVVFMGMGEPLTNFTEVSRAVRLLIDEKGMNMSARRITVSTVGLPAQIRRLADLKLPITLAISMHAPTDELRRELIPWAENVTIEQLIEAGRYFFEQTGREVTLEYTLIDNVNDQPEHAAELAVIAGRLRSNVNLIRYNEVEGLPFTRPQDQAVHRFHATLAQRGINVHLRASRGRDIDAACGQLRRKTAAGPA